MADLVLKYPVNTLDGRELLPAGSVLFPEILEKVMLSGKQAPRATLTLLEFGSVKADIISLLGQDSYRFIFSDETRKASVWDLLGKVRLTLPILESLSYFKVSDFYTYRHILMVFALTTLLAQDLVEDHKDLIQETVAGPTHDMGKVCVPLKILRKVNPLTRTDRNVLEHHSLAGYVLLSYYLQDDKGLVAKVARDHHERKDGSGYPSGILLADPLVEIVAASDIYDALLSPRPYRPNSYDNRTALEEITAMAERGQLPWNVVQALVALNRRSKPHYMACQVSMEKRGSPPAGSNYGLIRDEESDPSDDLD